MTVRSAIGDTLLAAVREDGPRARAHVAGVDPKQLAVAGRYHGAAGYLHVALRDHPVEPAIAEAVAQAYHLGLGLAMRAIADLASVRDVLDGAGVAWLVVKGPTVAERLYPEPGLRAYNDIDLVVRPDSFERAVDALTAAGNQVVDRNWSLLHREMRGQIHVELGHGTLADLHWHLINRDRVAFAIEMGEIFERARLVDIAGSPVRTSDAEDTLLHLCVHAYLAGANKLVWMKDIERAIRVEAIRWDELVARARRWRVGLPTAAMLVRAKRTLGADVPVDVPAALGSRIRRGLDRVAVRATHPERTTTGRSFAALAPRLLARAPAYSALVYGRRVASRLRGGPADPEEMILVPAGDDADRRAFLDGVARIRNKSS